MEKIDKIVSVHFYIKDLSDVTIKDLTNVDRLILVFARHVFLKENKIFRIENQFEARLDGDFITIIRFKEDVVGQFMKMISSVWRACLQCPYDGQGLWASENWYLKQVNGKLSSSIPREFFDSFLKISEVAKYFHLKTKCFISDNTEGGSLKRYDFFLKKWPSFDEDFFMHDYCGLYTEYLHKKTKEVQIVTKTKVHSFHQEVFLCNGGEDSHLYLKDKECQIDCREYQDKTIEAYLDFIYLEGGDDKFDFFKGVEHQQIYKLAKKFNQRLLINSIIYEIFKRATVKDIKKVEEMIEIYPHPHLNRLLKHLQFLNKK